MSGIEKLVTGINQVCVVVNDLDATIRGYVEQAGIGPWAVYTYAPPDLTKMRIRGRDEPFSMRLALAWTKGFMWEVIQPLEGPSIYKEFLAKNGEGMHHVLVEHEGHAYDEALAAFRARGAEPIMEGHFRGTDFAYVETDGPLKMILEIVKRPNYPGYRRAEPEYWYPAPPEVSPL